MFNNFHYNWSKLRSEKQNKSVGVEQFGRSISYFVSRDLENIIGNFITKHISDLYEVALTAFVESYLKSF